MTTHLNLEEIFAGLDDVEWPHIGFSYAEFPAEKLRTIGSADAEVAREAVGDFWAAMNTRAPRYPATVECIPFLARLCAAGVFVGELLELLHSVAYGLNQPRDDQDALVAAVAAELPLLLPRLDDPDEDNRRWTIGIIALCGRSREAAEAIRGRWTREPDSDLRTEMLNACRHADPEIAAELSVAAIAPQEAPELRLAATLSLVLADALWTPELAAAATAWALPGDDVESAERWFDTSTGDWKETDRDDKFVELLGLLAGRGALAEAAALAQAVLAVDGPGEGFRRRRALSGIDELCGEYRGAPVLLAPLLVPLVADEDAAVAEQVLAVLHRIGPEGRLAADAVLAVADSRDGSDDELADKALGVLLDLGDPRAVPLLARDLPRRRNALEVAIGRSWRGGGSTAPFDPALLDAARDLLRNPDRRNSSAPRHLCSLLASWGAEAAPALPELYSLLDKNPQHAPAAIAAVAAGTDAAAEAAARLTALADAASSYDRMFAADALHKLTGDAAPLVAALGQGLAGVLYELRYAMPRAGQLGAAGEPLLPRLRELLAYDDRGWTTDDRMAAASSMYAIAGDAVADELLPVLSTALDKRSAAATWLVRRIGIPAASLAPQLAPLLGSLRTALAAAGALLALARSGPGKALPDPIGSDGVISHDDLAEVLLTIVEYGGRTKVAIALLRQLGGGTFEPAAVDALRRILANEHRPPPIGYELDRIHNDQDRVAAIGAALAE
ncbi:hypothetical protein [Dactylosporangium cerinum]